MLTLLSNEPRADSLEIYTFPSSILGEEGVFDETISLCWFVLIKYLLLRVSAQSVHICLILSLSAQIVPARTHTQHTHLHTWYRSWWMRGFGTFALFQTHTLTDTLSLSLSLYLSFTLSLSLSIFLSLTLTHKHAHITTQKYSLDQTLIFKSAQRLNSVSFSSHL